MSVLTPEDEGTLPCCLTHLLVVVVLSLMGRKNLDDVTFLY